MATRYNDPTLARDAIRMKAAGVKRCVIARSLGVSLTTVDWYVRRAKLPANHRLLFACPGCGCRSTDPAGHPHCTRVA